MPYYWIVDPDARTIDAYRLVEGTCRLAERMEGESLAALSPFPDLALAPGSIWR